MRANALHLVAIVAIVSQVGCSPDQSPAALNPADTTANDEPIVPAGMLPQRLRLVLNDATNHASFIPASAVTAAEGAIGPGSMLLITIPEEGTFGCTANFVWRAGVRGYLGAAGHCFLPESKSATHGPGADYDAAGVTVSACLSGCSGNFSPSEITGTWVTLGPVEYARQTLNGVDVGNDFGLVRIPADLEGHLQMSVPVWGGPTGVKTLEEGDIGCHYGNGLGVGDFFVNKARTGTGDDSNLASWIGEFDTALGDAGSAMEGCANGASGLAGTGAVGIVTHVGARADPATNTHGVALGTTVAGAVALAQQAGLGISIVLP